MTSSGEAAAAAARPLPSSLPIPLTVDLYRETHSICLRGCVALVDACVLAI